MHAPQSRKEDPVRTPRLALLLASALMLAGCPGLPGISGSTTLDPKLLSVTSASQGITTATVTLSWDAISNAATYQITRKVADGSAKLLATTDKTTYTDQVNPGLTLTYTVQAFDASGTAKGSATPETVVVASAQVGKPSGLLVDGAATSTASGTQAKSSKPTLTWTPAASASAYYVTLTEDQSGHYGQVVYAALVTAPTATVGTLAQDGLSVPGYPQVKGDGGLVKGVSYFYSVTAIRTDVPDLSKAKAFDVSTVDDSTFVSFL